MCHFWVIGFGLPLVLPRFFDVKRGVVACCHLLSQE